MPPSWGWPFEFSYVELTVCSMVEVSTDQLEGWIIMAVLAVSSTRFSFFAGGVGKVQLVVVSEGFWCTVGS